MVVEICQLFPLIDNLQNSYKPRVKLFPHSNYTPLFIIYKNIWTCNSFHSKFHFLDSNIGNIYNSFTINTKLFMYKYLVDNNFLPMNLGSISTIVCVFPSLQIFFQKVLSWCDPLHVE
jgi:hypothetical protein